MKNHVYDFKNIVVGHSLEAVQYAYYNGYPIILNSKKAPFKFDEVEAIRVADLQKEFTRAEQIWSVMLFEHGMKGLVPFGSGPARINIRGNEMTISVRDSLTVRMSFEKCLIFEDDGVVAENEVVCREIVKKKYRVIDWIDVRVGTEHNIEVLEDASDFVQKVYFYPSERIDGNHDRKDCVAVSYLTEEQLNEFDFSDTMVKFKVEKMMNAAGIMGAKRGFQNDNKQKISKIKLEPKEREVELLNKAVYKNSEFVEFIGSSE